MVAEYIIGDVFDGLATLDDGSVDLVVTSPPFLALRSYLPADHEWKDKEIGSEATPAEFLDVMFAFTAELRRVLAPHGSIAIELGDTYASMGINWQKRETNFPRMSRKRSSGALAEASPLEAIDRTDGWPLAKSKTLIPELYRIGLAYGINPLTGLESPAGKWRVRNVVTWARPNPPVGALGDKWRPATSDVVIACLSGKRYWDDLATRKPHTEHSLRYYVEGAEYLERLQADESRHAAKGKTPLRGDGGFMQSAGVNPSGAPLLDYWEIPLDGGEAKPYGPKEKPPRDPASYTGNGYTKGHPEGVPGNESMPGNAAGAPLLDYWEIPPTGYSGSHYAVFPPALVVPLVKAMAPSRVCRVCGEPSRRIVEQTTEYEDLTQQRAGLQRSADNAGRLGMPSSARPNGSYQDAGFTDCGHDSWRPGLVCDPFAGSGTTLLVATGHGHDAIGFDLDSRNAELALERVGPFLLEVVDLAGNPV